MLDETKLDLNHVSARHLHIAGQIRYFQLVKMSDLELKQKMSARSASQKGRVTMFHLRTPQNHASNQSCRKDDTRYSKANANGSASCNVVRSDREQTNCRTCARTRRLGE